MRSPTPKCQVLRTRLVFVIWIIQKLPVRKIVQGSLPQVKIGGPKILQRRDITALGKVFLGKGNIQIRDVNFSNQVTALRNIIALEGDFVRLFGNLQLEVEHLKF